MCLAVEFQSAFIEKEKRRIDIFTLHSEDKIDIFTLHSEDKIEIFTLHSEDKIEIFTCVEIIFSAVGEILVFH